MNDTRSSQYDQFKDGELYDLAYDPGNSKSDLEMYLKLAKETGGPILEMGSGTGRVQAFFAENDIQITGIEVCEKMIKFAQAKARDRRLRPDQFQRITWIRGDMANTTIVASSFGLVIFPFSSLLENPNESAVAKSIKNAYWHLRPGGKMVVDNFFYGPAGAPRPNRVLRNRRERTTRNEQKLVFFDEDYFDLASGETIRWLHIHHVDDQGQTVQKENPKEIKRVYVPPDRFRSLALAADFQSEAIKLFGSFDLQTSLDDPRFVDPDNKEKFQKARQVWVCQKQT